MKKVLGLHVRCLVAGIDRGRRVGIPSVRFSGRSGLACSKTSMAASPMSAKKICMITGKQPFIFTTYA